MLRSCEPGSFFVAALATFGMEELALSYIEALPGNWLPFVETSLAEGDAFGACLQAGFAVGAKIDNVVHLPASDALQP
jgi:hypothetical protein